MTLGEWLHLLKSEEVHVFTDGFQIKGLEAEINRILIGLAQKRSPGYGIDAAHSLGLKRGTFEARRKRYGLTKSQVADRPERKTGQSKRARLERRAKGKDLENGYHARTSAGTEAT